VCWYCYQAVRWNIVIVLLFIISVSGVFCPAGQKGRQSRKTKFINVLYYSMELFASQSQPYANTHSLLLPEL